MKRKILYLILAVFIFIFAGCNNPASHEMNTSDLRSETALNTTENTTDKDNLLYQQIQGPSITLEKGEKIHISVENAESYNDVFIFLIGKDVVQKIGTLDNSTPFSFQVSVSGEYVIYAGEKDINITDKVTVEYLQDVNNKRNLWFQ